MVRGVCRGLSECHKGREGINIVAPALCYVLGGQESLQLPSLESRLLVIAGSSSV